MPSSLVTKLRRFGPCERGATAIEYGLICVVMALAILAAFQLLKEPLMNLFTFVAGKMTAEAPSG